MQWLSTTKIWTLENANIALKQLMFKGRGFLNKAYLIHGRLCEWRLVNFIVSKSAVANNVHNTVCLEFVTPLCCKLASMYNSLYIVTIDMEDWCIKCLGNISAVWWRSAWFWICCKCNLYPKWKWDYVATLFFTYIIRIPRLKVPFAQRDVHPQEPLNYLRNFRHHYFLS